MVICPNCGIKGNYCYTPIATLDRDFDGNKMIEINKAECYECHHQFIIKEIYKIDFDNAFNVD